MPVRVVLVEDHELFRKGRSPTGCGRRKLEVQSRIQAAVYAVRRGTT